MSSTSMNPGARAPRLQVLAPRGPLPHWLAEALRSLEIRRIADVGVLGVDAPAGAGPERPSWLERWSVGRLPPLRPWGSAEVERRCLQRWQSEAAGGAPDLRLSFVTDAAEPPEAATPGHDGGAPLRWAVVDAGGAPLGNPRRLLSRLSRGEGLRIHCLELDPTAACWRVRRTLHVAAPARCREGLSQLGPAVVRLLELAIRDRQVELSSDPAPGRLSRWEAPRRDLGAGAPSAVVAAWRGVWRDRWLRHRERWISEHWRIGVIDRPIAALVRPGPLPPVRWLTDDRRAGYWADPFGIPGDSRRVACEFFDEAQGIGRLEVLDFDADDRMTGREALPVGSGGHVSFPSVFDIDGRRVGLAETVGRRECILHDVDAGGHWHPFATLLHGTAAADPVLFRFEGRYWIAYTDADHGGHDNLCLQHAERLEGPWLPHACNPVKVDLSSARMAGQPFLDRGILYRPAQDCVRSYGAAIVLHRIVELTPTRFVEVEVRRLEPNASGPCPDGLHTLNAWGARTLVDGKRHGFNPVAVGRKLKQAAPAKPGSRAPVRAPRMPASTPQAARRALVYVPHLRTGGGETSMLRLAEGLAAAGLQVDLVVHTLSTAELPVPAGVGLISLDCRGTLAAIGRLATVIRSRRPQWVLSAFPHTNIAAILARARSGTDACCVLTEHAPLSRQIAETGGWRYRLLPPLMRWAYRRADAVVAVSNGVRDDLQVLAGLASSPRVIGNPILPADLAAEIARPPDHRWLRDPALDIVLSVSRLSAEKDLATLLHAFAEVHRARPSARLLIAGDGPERARLDALRDALGLGDVVDLPGRTGQPLRWMHHAAVFVLASRFEGFGNVLIEALASGTPVVSTDCPVGPREILRDGAYGALVPVGDAPAMASAILRALETRSPPQGAREAALAYTQARACGAYLRLFESLPARAVRPC